MLSLDTLNVPQRNAVTYQGPRHCLILAGAGSGKTRVLTYRIAWLISQGVDPKSILAITFTNKAAAEMRDRATALIAQNTPDAAASGVLLSTFHAFGARFLHQFGAYAGLHGAFSIYAESEQKALVKSVMTELAILHPPSDAEDRDARRENASVGDTLELIQNFKEKNISVEEAKKIANSREETDVAAVYERYERRLLDNNAVDFAGLLLWPLHILKTYDLVRARIQRQYRHILVDEFQDTNTVQLDLLGMLCGPEARITAVGDDDQSIYTWRGAEPTAILDFSKRFGECEIFKLEQNYRSTHPILTCAANLIDHNIQRAPKRLWTERQKGEPVHIVSYDGDSSETYGIIREIQRRRRTENLDWNHFAILFRKNSMSVGFERACAEQGIPYQLVKSMGFFEREEIVDLMAYLRLVVNPADTMALRRILNRPARNIGDKTCDRITELLDLRVAKSQPTDPAPTPNAPNLPRQHSLFEPTPVPTAVPVPHPAPQDPADMLMNLFRDIVDGHCKLPRATAKTLQGCASFLSLLESILPCQSRSPGEVLQTILDQSQYITHLQKTMARKGADFDEAQDRIQSLLSTLNAYERDHDDGLAGFLESMALVRPEADAREDSIKLMTIHSAKGLEFDVVFIAGIEEGILPLDRGGTCDVEEERRLMYVAMTRAKRVLTLSHADQRFEFGHTLLQEKSRFFQELDAPGLIDATIAPVDSESSHATRPKLAWSSRRRHDASPSDDSRKFYDISDEVGEGITRPFGRKRDRTSPPSPRHVYNNSAASPRQPYLKACDKQGAPVCVGSSVTHAIHGNGRVIALEANTGDFKATVDFVKSGIRTIIARFLLVTDE